MDLNKMIPKAGSAIVTVTVFLFALFLIINYSMGSFFVCIILPLGFIMMTAGLHNECENDRKVAANIGLVLAAVYCVFIMLVYFTQLTTVKNEDLNEQAVNLLAMSRLGLICLLYTADHSKERRSERRGGKSVGHEQARAYLQL